MTPRAQLWADLARAAEGAGGPRFEPVPAEAMGALRERFDLPPWLEELLRVGYPTAALQVGGKDLFPPIPELLAFHDDRPDWPRAWLPIEWSNGHLIHLLRSDAEGLWHYYSEGDEPEGEHMLPPKPDWPSFDEVLEVLGVLCAEVRKDGFASHAERHWLRPAVVARVQERLGERRAKDALPFFHLDTVEDARSAWRDDAGTALIFMVIMGLFGAIPLVLLATPGHGPVWPLVLLLGIIPWGLLIYFTLSWRTARAKLRRLLTAA